MDDLTDRDIIQKVFGMPPAPLLYRHPFVEAIFGKSNTGKTHGFVERFTFEQKLTDWDSIVIITPKVSDSLKPLVFDTNGNVHHNVILFTKDHHENLNPLWDLLTREPKYTPHFPKRLLILDDMAGHSHIHNNRKFKTIIEGYRHYNLSIVAMLQQVRVINTAYRDQATILTLHIMTGSELKDYIAQIAAVGPAQLRTRDSIEVLKTVENVCHENPKIKDPYAPIIVDSHDVTQPPQIRFGYSYPFTVKNPYITPYDESRIHYEYGIMDKEIFNRLVDTLPLDELCKLTSFSPQEYHDFLKTYDETEDEEDIEKVI